MVKIVAKATGKRVSFDWESVKQFARKPRTVKAVRLSEPISLTDSRGTKEGEAGDWLIRNHYGCFYLTSNAIFIDEYYELPWKTKRLTFKKGVSVMVKSGLDDHYSFSLERAAVKVEVTRINRIWGKFSLDNFGEVFVDLPYKEWDAKE